MTGADVRAWLRLVALPLGLTVLGLLTLPVLGEGPPGAEQGRPPWADEGWGPGPSPDSAFTEPGVLAGALVVLAAAALLLRRVRPEACLVIATAATGIYLALGYPYGPILLSLALAVYFIARHRPLRPALLWAGGALLGLGLLAATREGALTRLLPAIPWMALPFTIGLVRALTTDARTRARVDADRRLVEAERLRLAQEVHDVVGHGLAAIQMQADIALHVRESRPDQPVEALRAISSASDQALAELRATLTSIRPGDDSSGLTAPTPGLDRLDDLCERVRSAGVEVDLRVDGEPRPLPDPVDLAAYRVVQESLTNVVRHSAERRAEVRVTHGPEDVEVTVTNRDDAPGTHTPGLGIEGMHRRAEQLGGSLTAGPGVQPGAFVVHAVLPIDSQSDSDSEESP